MALLTFASSCATRYRQPPHPAPGGIATVRVAGAEAWRNGTVLLQDGETLFQGDRVQTGARTSVRIDFLRGGSVQLAPDTDPVVEEMCDEGTLDEPACGQLQEIIREGICRLKVLFRFGRAIASQEPGDECQILLAHTDKAGKELAFLLSGTEVSLEMRPPLTLVTVRHGRIEVEGQSVVLRPGEQAQFLRGRLVLTRTLTAAELARTFEWRDAFRFPDRSTTSEGAKDGKSWSSAAVIAGALAVVAAIVTAALLAGRDGHDDDSAGQQAWCCLDGTLTSDKPRTCRQREGTVLHASSRKAADRKCTPASPGPTDASPARVD